MHIWTLENWGKFIKIDAKNHRTGLRLKFDSDIEPEVKRACKEFAKWLRKEYFFPIRVPVYIKNSSYIKAIDGEKVFGVFFRPDDYTVEPYIRIATGDYLKMFNEWGKDSALAVILKTIAHELTHYFQWVNHISLTLIGEERQATRYSRFILDEYAKNREHP